jgi:hypothetical protein
VPINVVTGWNWIGFTSRKNITVTEALGNYNATAGDLLKGQFSFAYYDANMGWLGSLTTMVPGEGYMLKATNASTFKYPATAVTFGRVAHSNVSVANSYITNDVQPENFSKTMSVIAQTNICKEVLDNKDVMLKAYVGTELRGIAKPTWVQAKNQYVFFLTAYSNADNETINFKFDYASEQKTFNASQSISFTDNSLTGTSSEPFTISILAADTCDAVALSNNTTAVTEVGEENTSSIIKDDLVEVYPNPFSDLLNVRFNKPFDGVVEITDAIGQLVHNQKLNNANATEINFNKLDNGLSKGIYIIKITSKQKISTYKLIKQ